MKKIHAFLIAIALLLASGSAYLFIEATSQIGDITIRWNKVCFFVIVIGFALVWVIVEDYLRKKRNNNIEK